MNKKLNILILNPLALENGRGGEISSIELACGLQNFYNITLMDTNILTGKSLLSPKVIKKKLKEVKREKKLRFATFKFFNKILTFPYPWEFVKLNREIQNNNIVYTSTFTIKIDLLLIFLSLIHRKTKFIIGFRKPLFSEKFFSLYNLKYRFTILLFSLVKKRFYFHTISYHAKKFLENFYDQNRTFHIVHGIDLDDYIDDGMKVKQNETLNFIYVGYLDDIHKGVNILLEGIEKVIGETQNLEFFFEFCGEGPLESRLKKLQKKYPEFIRYNGYISHDKIAEYYKRNDIFLFTSRREPFGRVLIEAIASNLIIICTKTFGSIEILKNKKFAFFIQDLNSDLIRDKILFTFNLWRDKNKQFQELQKSSKTHALENYSLNTELKMFKELIKNISRE